MNAEQSRLAALFRDDLSARIPDATTQEVELIGVLAESGAVVPQLSLCQFNDFTSSLWEHLAMTLTGGLHLLDIRRAAGSYIERYAADAAAMSSVIGRAQSTRCA